MVALFVGEIISTTYHIQRFSTIRRVTDRQTDRQTDGIPQSGTLLLSLAAVTRKSRPVRFWTGRLGTVKKI